MPTPLFACGLAAEGKDVPFHALESELRSQGLTESTLTGREASGQMTAIAFLFHDPSAAAHDMPYECSIETARHNKDCRTADCGHDKQCDINKGMWRTLEDQNTRRPYAGELSDAMAQHLLDFYLEDMDRIRRDLSSTLQSHGDIVLKRWKKMSRDKRGILLSDAAHLVFGTWPVVTGTCSEPDCYELHGGSWPYGGWLTLESFAEDWSVISF